MIWALFELSWEKVTSQSFEEGNRRMPVIARSEATRQCRARNDGSRFLDKSEFMAIRITASARASRNRRKQALDFDHWRALRWHGIMRREIARNCNV
jgi:hypothetical protein